MKRLFYSIVMIGIMLPGSNLNSTAGTVVSISKSQSSADDQRKVSGFTGISSSGSFDVKITMGTKESLRLQGDKEAIEEIETVVEKGILKIKNKSRSGWNMNFRREKVIIYVEAKSLNTITLSGSGKISVNGVVKANRLANNLSGSGSITLSADTREYVAAISGSGEIFVKGNADRAQVKISGSGDFEGKNLKTSEAEVHVSGSGNASIFANKTLHAVISGSGNISYGGDAKVSRTKSGSGSITKI
jgi:hypothetical protein